MNQIKTSSTNDLKKFIDDKSFKKIFIIAGNQSFNLSGLKKFFQDVKDKNIKFFFKVNPYPEYEELIKITKEIELFSPDLIIAAGGGSVIDYAKIANVISADLDKLVQMPPGSYLKFREVTLEEAEKIFNFYNLETNNFISQIS